MNSEGTRLAEPELRFCAECGVDFLAKDKQERFCKTKRCLKNRGYEKAVRYRERNSGRRSVYVRDKSFYEPRRSHIDGDGVVVRLDPKDRLEPES